MKCELDLVSESIWPPLLCSPFSTQEEPRRWLSSLPPILLFLLLRELEGSDLTSFGESLQTAHQQARSLSPLAFSTVAGALHFKRAARKAELTFPLCSQTTLGPVLRVTTAEHSLHFPCFLFHNGGRIFSWSTSAAFAPWRGREGRALSPRLA